MNPFERIAEMKKFFKTEIIEKDIKPTDMISQKEHYARMINMLNILSEEMKEAEYNYQVKSVDNKVTTFDNLTVLQKDLNDDIIIFQPIAIGEQELSAIDMQSLADVLTKLRDSGTIKENIVLLPPNINVFRAKLAPAITDEHLEINDWEEEDEL